MRSEVIELDDIESGIDRKQLQHLKQRFLSLNRERYRRMHQGLTERQQMLVDLLPLLFHVNHPILPGYVCAGAPAGVAHYQPKRQELRLARSLARSFALKREIGQRHLPIQALFVMGSPGTIAQSETSDLDVWLCHDPQLPTSAQQQLRKKCDTLSRWAQEGLHLELHFFVMPGGRFHAGPSGRVSAEGAGSTQRYLLLDEFYRTALWLAGRLPLWWFVPSGREADYENYKHQLLHHRFLPEAEVIDFGGLPSLPAEEFVGAGIWQLYKGIESPYKSVLKLLLLEAYAQSDQPRPLALDFKEAVYRQIPEVDELDPYLLIYRRLEAYLGAGAEWERLELVRRCFYFKVGKALTRPAARGVKSWQRQRLERLVAEWRWPEHQLKWLDSRPQWKAPEVLAERTQLVRELSRSYHLINSLHKTGTDNFISDEDLNLLGRKLHAAFERKAGKVEWVNPDIARDLSEPELFFMPSRNSEGEVEYWQLYRGLNPDLTEPGLKRARQLIELLLWCYANGLLTAASRYRVDRKAFSPAQCRQLFQCLSDWLPLPLPAPEHQAFTTSARVERLLVLFNLGVEPQAQLREQGLLRLSDWHDALDFSGLRENLVLSLDVVQINTWHEISCRHYQSDALVHALEYYLRLVPPGGGQQPPPVTLRCLGDRGPTLVQRLEELWVDLIECFYRDRQPPTSRYLLEMAGQYLLIQFFQQQPSISRYPDYQALLDKLSEPQSNPSALVVDRRALKDRPLKLIAQTARPSGVYLFYWLDPKREDTAEVSLVDPQGTLVTTLMSYHSRASLVRPLVYFLEAALARQAAAPELLPALGVTPKIHVYEIAGDPGRGRGFVESRPVRSDLEGLAMVSVQAIAEPNASGGISFTIYCDGEEFSELDWGEQVYTQVALCILQFRRQGLRYPCYITDLDLSQCRDLLAPQQGLQLSHYWQVKWDLEQKLNLALAEQ